VSFFTWKNSFSVGIVEIDEQHKKLLEYLNELHIQSHRSKGKRINPIMIDRLNSYAKTHFRYEETLMKNRGYPELESHKRFHTYFETQLQEFEKLAVAGSKVATKTVFKFLRDWFLDHILEEDHKYIPYVRTKKNGV